MIITWLHKADVHFLRIVSIRYSELRVIHSLVKVNRCDADNVTNQQPTFYNSHHWETLTCGQVEEHAMLHNSSCGMNKAITECNLEAFPVNRGVFIDVTLKSLTEQNRREEKRRITAYQASLFLGSNQSASFRAPHTFLRYSLTLNSSTLTAWKNDRYFASLREICVFPLPGRPQKQIQNLSVAIGNILNGIEFSMLWPTAADAPGAAWGIGLYSLFVL